MDIVNMWLRDTVEQDFVLSQKVETCPNMLDMRRPLGHTIDAKTPNEPRHACKAGFVIRIHVLARRLVCGYKNWNSFERKT